MTCGFLPIAERELRAAARRRGTYHFRWWAALLAVAVSFIWLGSRSRFALPGMASSPLFALQSAGAFGLALLAGAFFTSDCLSEEKRDGTLGLLFLTNLTARDIVVGKFAALSLSAFNGLLALLPVTAVPLLLGGVELAEFWRMTLALVNTLFFSLALGLSLSAFVTDYSRAVAGTLALLTVFGAGLPLIAELVLSPSRYAGWSKLAWVSPFYPFACAGAATYALEPHKFWSTLLGSHLTGWFCLMLASARLAHSWRERDTAFPRPALRSKQPQAGRRGGQHQSPKKRYDPVLRLVGNTPLLRCIVWVLALGGGGWLWTGRFWLGQPAPEQLVSRGCAFLLKALFAFQACRFFVETRRNGALELLLCTPLRTEDLIAAQWRHLRRVFLWPVAVFLLLSWSTIVFGTSSSQAGIMTPRSPPDLESRANNALFLTAGLGADTLAAGWFGMWLGLTGRKPGLAPGLTILAVLILPTFLYRFDLVADMLFISWGTTRLREDFRAQIALGVPAAPRR